MYASLLGVRRPTAPLSLEDRGAFTVPQKGYAKRGSNRQITKKSLLSHFEVT